MPSSADTPRQARGGAAAGRDDDALVLDGLRTGNEDAFARLVDRYGASMLRVAGNYVRDRAVAEEVVQETWVAVLQGIDRFEGRSSLRTWLFTILANRAKSCGEREGRGVPLSALIATDVAVGEPAVDPDRFLGVDDSRWPYHWAAPPRAWPEDRLIEAETMGVIRKAIAELPESQRQVIRLRDVEGWSAEEVVGSMEISDANQRVLLHRARSRVRAALEGYLDPGFSA
jgi:RNA polymerase sigma-70 factor (ECF subfamily)